MKTTPQNFHRVCAVLLALLALPDFALAQKSKSKAPKPAQVAVPESVPRAVETPVPAPVLPESKPAPPPKPAPDLKGGILLNFQGASLNEVLNYLSEAAGFVIVQDAPLTGTVNVMSRQPVSAEEAVDLLNTVLVEKGYVALRNGRILKIVNRKDAQKRDLPVEVGSDPERIPRKDEMVTQILPLRFGEASKLVENLKPLLAESATISANEGSNTILLTDTQTNVRRIAQIITAIDTSVSSISTIHIFPLQFADAKAVALTITQLFANSTMRGSSSSDRSSRSRSSSGFPFPGFGDRGGGDRPPGSSGGGNEARDANARVVAVADEQSNSLIVSAPEELIPTITDVVGKIDTSITDFTETRIFRLEHADAVELAEILAKLYSDADTQTNQRRSGSSTSGGPPSPMDFFNRDRGSSSASSQRSERALRQSRVVAVGDPRTNSLLISAARDTMMEIAETVGRLDATDARKQRVFVHSLQHADAQSVADVLRGMLGETTVSQNQNTGTGRLTERSASGAAMDASQALGGSSSGGGGRSGR